MLTFSSPPPKPTLSLQHARGCLTDNNKPCGHCAVCQFTMEVSIGFLFISCFGYALHTCTCLHPSIHPSIRSTHTHITYIRPSMHMCIHFYQEDDVFVRTSCYHYFHRSCMAHYIRFFRQEQSRSAGTQQAKKVVIFLEALVN